MERRNFFKWLGGAAIVAVLPKIELQAEPAKEQIVAYGTRYTNPVKELIPPSPDGAIAKLFFESTLIAYCVGAINLQMDYHREEINVRSLDDPSGYKRYISDIRNRSSTKLTIDNIIFQNEVYNKYFDSCLQLEITTVDKIIVKSDCYFTSLSRNIPHDNAPYAEAVLSLIGDVTITEDKRKRGRPRKA